MKIFNWNSSKNYEKKTFVNMKILLVLNNEIQEKARKWNSNNYQTWNKFSYNFIKRWNVNSENFTFIFIYDVRKITEYEVWKSWEIEFNLGGNK